MKEAKMIREDPQWRMHCAFIPATLASRFALSHSSFFSLWKLGGTGNPIHSVARRNRDAPDVAIITVPPPFQFPTSLAVLSLCIIVDKNVKERACRGDKRGAKYASCFLWLHRWITLNILVFFAWWTAPVTSPRAVMTSAAQGKGNNGLLCFSGRIVF